MVVLRKDPQGGRARLDRKLGQYGLDADRGRDVMDEVDQRRKASDGQDHAERHGDHRHEDGFAASPNGSEDQQAIDEGGQERPKHNLIAPISHEIAQHSGTELRRCQLQGQHCHRECDARDRDHRARDSRQDRARALWAEGIGPFVDPSEPCRLEGIQPDQQDGRCHSRDCHDRRQEPETAVQSVP
jgi:hypothetical protein